jgi:hypothetical protein
LVLRSRFGREVDMVAVVEESVMTVLGYSGEPVSWSELEEKQLPIISDRSEKMEWYCGMRCETEDVNQIDAILPFRSSAVQPSNTYGRNKSEHRTKSPSYVLLIIYSNTPLNRSSEIAELPRLTPAPNRTLFELDFRVAWGEVHRARRFRT